MRPDNSKLVSLLLFLSVALLLFGCDFSKDEGDDEAIHYINKYERMNFWDTNWQPYKLGGKLRIDRARNESQIVEYRLYWGWGPNAGDKYDSSPICIWTKQSSGSRAGSDWEASFDSNDLGSMDELTLTFSRVDATPDPSGAKNCKNVPSGIPEKESHTVTTSEINDPDQGIQMPGRTLQYYKRATHFLLYTKSQTGAEQKFSQSFPIKDNMAEHLATMAEDMAYDVAVDGQGNIYVAGATRGDIINERMKYAALYYVDYEEGDLVYENYSYSDAFLKKYDSASEVYSYDSVNVKDATTEYSDVPNLERVTEVVLRTTAPLNNHGVDIDNAPKSWEKQWGGVGSDAGLAVAVDSKGYVYVTGYTFSDQQGNPGDIDYFLVKHSPSGDRVWQRQEGTENDDIGKDVVVDRFGNIYVTGVTGGALAGVHKGKGDIFIFKYNSSGQKIWQRQIGTAAAEAGHALAVDRYGNVTLVGEVSVDESGDDNPDSSDTADINDRGLVGRDAFVIKTDRYGGVLWRRDIRTDKLDRAYGVALDSHGNAYVAGESYENLSQLAYYLDQNMDKEEVYGPYLLKYDPYGNLIWVKHPGTKDAERVQSRGHARAVAVDAFDNIYVTGTVYNSVMEHVEDVIKGSNDSFLLRYDIWGNETWHKHIGTQKMDEGFGLALDSSGNVHLVGATNGYLPHGQTMARELHSRYNSRSKKDGFIIRPNTKLSKPYLSISRGRFLKYRDIAPPDKRPYKYLGNGVGYHVDCDKLAQATLALWSISWAYGLFETLLTIDSPFSLVAPLKLPLQYRFDMPLLGWSIPSYLLPRDYWTIGRIALDPFTYLVAGSAVTAGLYTGYCHNGGHFWQ